MPGAIFVRSDITLAAGQSVAFSDPWTSADDPSGVYHAAYVLTLTWNQPAITVTDAGTITAADVDGQSLTLYGVTDFNGGFHNFNNYPPKGSLVEIASTGALTVITGGLSPSAAYGFYSCWGSASLKNDGAITVTNQGAGAAYGVAMNVGIVLGSPISMPGGFPLGGNVVNTGTIVVTAASGAGVEFGGGGFYGLGQVQLNNSGAITAHGGACGVLVGLPGLGGDISIFNSGQITATTGSSPSIGIDGSPADFGALKIVNTASGTITADHAIEVFAGPNSEASLDLTNTGTINGGVLVDASTGGAHGGAIVGNSGVINGDIKLLDGGPSVYDGRGGALNGALTVGDGTNSIHLGNDGETVYTGAGTNTLFDGAGADHLHGGYGADTISVVGGGDVLDGGLGFGLNTLSFQPAAGAITISLAITAAQSTGGAGTETISNFQNLTGSKFADHLTGSAADNVMDGGGGDDVIDGGAGSNTIAFSTAASGVTVNLNLQGGAQNTGDGALTLSNFQNITGTVYADHLTGNANNNLFDTGGGGNDVIDGGGGSNTVSFASVVRTPADPFPQSIPGVTVDLNKQGQAQDTGAGIVTLSHVENLIGSQYDDTFVSDAADNTFDGGSGANTVSYAEAPAAVTIVLVHTQSTPFYPHATGAGSGTDFFQNISGATGSAYDDDIIGTAYGRYDGGAGTDTLDLSLNYNATGVIVDFLGGTIAMPSPYGVMTTGSVANIEKLIATPYDDTIYFGAGDRTVTGGAGADTFILAPSAGKDVVTDFSGAAGDKIDLSGLGTFYDLQGVLAAASQAGADTLITLGSGSLRLQNVSLASLTAADFKLSPGPTVGPGIGGTPTMGSGTVNGTSGSDWLQGSPGAAVLHGGPGSDYLDGGTAYTATALYDGAYRQYTVTTNSSPTTVAGGPEGGLDVLVNIQRIQFVDGYLSTSTGDRAGQVYRVYEATLNRAPDEEGLTNWVHALDHFTSLTSVVDGFVNSQEFQNTYGSLDDTQFVTLLYHNVLHRDPDAAGLASWLGSLGQYHSRANVVLGFSESLEDINDWAAPVHQGLWIGDAAAGQVARLYDAVLGRLPDGSGLASWTHALESGRTLQGVADGFVGSQEFQSVYGALNNNDYVTLLYHNVLHRDPDTAGLNNWVGLLNGGESRAQVAVGFSESGEHIGALAPYIDNGVWLAG